MTYAARVAVVILYYQRNDQEMTVACIDSVLASEFQDLIVYLVDACPAPVPPADMERWAGRVVHIPLGKNRGYAGGNNVGIRRALDEGATHIFLLNNDAFLEPESLGHCVSVLDAETDIAVVSPKILYKQSIEPETLVNVAGGEIDLNTCEAKILGDRQPDGSEHNEARDITFASGCALLIRSEVLREIGLFDEDLFLYCEDAEFSHRVIKAGKRIRYAPQAVVWHDHYLVNDRTSPLQRYYLQRNHIYNLKRCLQEDKTRIWLRWTWSTARVTLAYSIKHLQPRLGIATLVGAFDGLFRRMGKRDYWFMR